MKGTCVWKFAEISLVKVKKRRDGVGKKSPNLHLGKKKKARTQ